MDKKRSVIMTAVFFVFLFGFAAWHLILPDAKISVFERRKLEQAPEISLEAFFEGSLSKDLEDYLLDQFPLRQDFVTLNTSLRYYALGQTSQDDLFLQGDSVFEAVPLKENEVQMAANKFLSIMQEHLQNSNVYYSVIPDKGAFMENQGQPVMDYARLQEILDSTLTDAQKIDIWNLLSAEDYYKTDLHWKQENIYPVAQALAEAMDAEITPFEQYTMETLSPFYGSYYARSPKPLEAESLSYLTSSATKRAFVTGAEFNGRRPVYVPEKISDVDGYDVYLHGAQALLTVEIPNAQEKRELVIFRDSFTSSLAPYFVGGYSKITLVDLRYMSSSLLAQNVNFENADVLFLYSTTLLNNGSVFK